MKPATAWRIAYDIADPRRLARVHRFLVERAVPVQYSVFWASLDRRALDAMLRGIAERIDPRADDVRFYPIPERPRIEWIGRPAIPADLRWDAVGFDSLRPR